MVIEIETMRVNNENENNIKSLQIKINKAVKEAKEAEKIYKGHIKIANNERLNYVDGYKKIMNYFQKLEEDYIKFAKDFLMKYIIFQTQLVKNILFDHESKLGVLMRV